MGLIGTGIKLARSGAAVGSMAASFAAGAAVAVVNADRQNGANLASGMSAELGLAVAGVRLNIQGEENAWAERPAIFLFNHQSELDVLIVAAVVRRDFSGVAKKSLQTNPIFGPVGAFTGMAFIDRADPAKARKALQPVVDNLQNGISVVVAPEGTRSSALLPFKKGPFHMAIQGGVPIVPIVIRNAADIMPARSLLIGQGTVDVVVLPPVDTSDWRAETIGEHRDEVWQMYRDTLDDWPEPGDVDAFEYGYGDDALDDEGVDED